MPPPGTSERKVLGGPSFTDHPLEGQETRSRLPVRFPAVQNAVNANQSKAYVYFVKNPVLPDSPTVALATLKLLVIARVRVDFHFQKRLSDCPANAFW